MTGDGTNTYIVEDNFLLYGKNQAELGAIASTLFRKINQIQYRPFKASLRGNPCLEVGDSVIFYTKYKSVESYILERTIKGIQALKDSFESNGVFEYSEKLNSTNRDIKQLKGKTNKLERTVDMLNSEINDEENGLKSQITQTAQGLTSKVSKKEVVSEINQSAEEVKIKGEKIALEGTVTANDNFKVLEDGSIQAKNGTFEGIIESDGAKITGGEIKINGIVEGFSPILLRNNSGRFTRISGGDLEISRGIASSLIAGGAIYVGVGDSESTFTINGSISSDGSAMLQNLYLNGEKSRLVKTQNYNIFYSH